jgi:hypothetical protein
MKSTKFVSLLIFSVFLISCVSATIIVESYFQDDINNQQATITRGGNITFKAIISSTEEITQKTFQFPAGLTSTGNCTFSGHTYTCIYSIIGNAVGTYTIRTIGEDSSGSVDYNDVTLRVVSPADTTAPVITVTGANPVTIHIGDRYTDAGATATDNVDGAITVITTGSVNTAVIGVYTITYHATDAAGNSATATRTVNVIAVNPSDSTAPIITIHSPITGTTYYSTSQSLSFTVTDADLTSCAYSTDNGITRTSVSCSSGILRTISLTAIEGVNRWFVYATDAAGNSASAGIQFNVEIDNSISDTTAPIITILNPDVGERIKSSRLTLRVTTNEDATVVFVLDGEESKTMENHSGNLFTYEATGLNNGEHTVIFTATDEAGNSASESVAFNVHKSSSRSRTTSSEAETEKPATSKPTSTISPNAIIYGDKETAKISFFQKIINAIANFFKSLFGVK